MKLEIVGGSYLESCSEPASLDLFGSGLRAAAALCNKNFEIIFHTAVGEDYVKVAELKANTYDFRCSITNIDETIEFSYFHPLARPNGLNPNSVMLNLPPVSGKNLLVYGFFEAKVEIHGDYVVYDPQNHISFSETNSSAKHLALVLNKNEAELLCRFPVYTDLLELGQILLEKEKAQVVVIKNGAQGALVVEKNKSFKVPVFKTSKVWPIGSGDIFSAVFAWKWIIEKLEPSQAAYQASKYTAFYCATQQLPLPIELGDFNPIPISAEKKRKKIYLASPFFTSGERMLLNEVRAGLIEFGNDVFSPLHDSVVLDTGDERNEIQTVAMNDLAQIDECDVILAIASGMDPGTVFEVGYAVAREKKVVILAENIKDKDMFMFIGSNCNIVRDLSSAVYNASW